MGRVRLFSLLAILTLLISLTMAIPIVHGDDPEDFSPPEKQELQYPNLGSHLNQLVDAVEEGSLSPDEAAADSPIHSAGSVAVTIHLSGNVDDVVQFLEDNGGDPRNVGEGYIEAYVPVTLLGALSEQPGVIRVREIVPPQPDYGPLTSQGVQTHLAQAWHDAGYSGQGIKVGIIDGGFEGFGDLIGQELPAPVAVRCYTDIGEYTSNLADCEGEDVSFHGTGVAETLIDIAPAVSLYLARPLSSGDLRETVDWMISEGVLVINRSQGWPFDGPGDGTSPFGDSPLNTVDRAVDGGIIFVNSAGNQARHSWFQHGPFSIFDPDGDGDGAVEFVEGDPSNSISLGEGRGILAFVRWEGSWGGAATDFDLYVFDPDSGQVVAGSEDPQSGGGGQDPLELLQFQAPRDGTYEIFVTYRSGDLPDWIQLIVRGEVAHIEHYTRNGSIGNPGESANRGMLAVGATHYWDTNAIASYSSQGPTPDGRVKPDIVGTACGETASYEHHIRDGNDCWFAGTSQASPHVAGMAALVRQKYPDFTPQQVAQVLKDYAEERGDPGADNTWGSGFAVMPPHDTVIEPPIIDECGQTLTGDGTVPGTWAAGCESQARSGRYARYYTFTLAEQSEVTIALESSDADTYLNLWPGSNRTGDPLAYDDDSPDTTRSEIVATLQAGSYTIEATTFDAGETGSFTLSVAGLGGTAPPPGPDPSDECEAPLTGDGSVSGTWSAGCESEERSGRYARYYTFTLAEQSEVTIALESSDADTYLNLWAGSNRTGDPLAYDDDSPDTTRSEIVATLQPGSYTIEATTYDEGETGDFTLTVAGLGGTAPPPGPDPSDDCEAPLTGDGSVSGTWSAGCESEERSGRYARYYTFTLAEQSEVTIALESSDADTYLNLWAGSNRTGDPLAYDDDSPDTTRSEIVATLQPGSYTIEATTFDAGATGSFTLSVAGLGGTAPPPGPEPSDDCEAPLTGDDTVSGTWSAGCESEERSGRYARYYTFTLAEQSEVTIALESSDADTYLNLWAGSNRTGDPLAYDDDSPDITRSEIVATLQAGSYTIEATTFDAGATGSFTLSVAGLGGTAPPPGPEPSDDCEAPLTGDGTVSGTWVAECESQARSGRYARYYTFTLAEQSEVTIALESSDADTYLNLWAGSNRTGDPLAYDDDSPDITRSEIVATLQAGSYTIEATTFDAGATGSFTLTVTGLGTAPPPGPEPSDEQDRAVLVTLYNATDGANWTDNSGWLSDAPIGRWAGVDTNDNGKVTTLGLADNNLRGQLPVELGNLTNLQRLWLDRNQLSGTIPAQLGNLTSLVELSLWQNQLSGEIPADLGRLTSLERLYLSINQLSGEIPSDLGGITSLVDLNLSHNQLSGEIPAELGNLTSLEDLSLGGNQLTGEIPTRLGNLTSLEGLWLGGNQLTGDIPTELENLTNLEDLALSGNQLSGTIPAKLGDLTNLTRLSLNDNQLSGVIPTELGNLTNLETLDLRENQLSGVIPADLGNLTSLKALQLGGNQLSGVIPAGLGNLTSLTNLSLRENQLSGVIPTRLGNLTSLTNLSLRENQLSGVIPADLGNLTSLEYLSLGGNQLSGEIPTELGNLTSLISLSLWGNQLSGAIPAQLDNLSSLQRLWLPGNQLSGEIPAELGNLANLTGLRLDNNLLSGEIPSELGNLTNLTGLWLPGNQLSGVIPAQLGNLTELTNLILSANQLTGTIPAGLGNLTSLTLLALNTNELSGEIPPSLGRLTNLEILSLRNNQLSGEIPAELGNLDSLNLIYLAGNPQLTGCVPTGLKDVPDNDFARLGRPFCDGTPPPQEIVFADPGWPSVQLQTYIAKFMLEEGYGYATSSVSINDRSRQLAALLAGQADVLMEAYSTDSAPWEDAVARGDLLSLGTSLGHHWQSAFVIPAYLQEQYPQLDNVEDLKEPQYKNLFATAESGGKAQLVSCVSGSSCADTNPEQVTGYGLDEHVHIVNPDTWEDHHNSINGAYRNQEPWLGYIWATGAPALLLDLVRLEEPPYTDECWASTKSCAYEDIPVLIVANLTLSDEAPDVVDFLRKWDFSIEVDLKSVTRWQADNPGASFEELGLYWLNNNEATWSSWVTSEAAARIRSALSES